MPKGDINTHRERVQRALRWKETQRVPINRIQLEAVVEFFLLEDIERHYRMKKLDAQARNVRSDLGKYAHNKTIEICSQIVDTYCTIIEVARELIDLENYSAVSKAIPEGQLMRNARNPRKLRQLKESTILMLKNLMRESLNLTELKFDDEDILYELESHEANYKKIKGLPSQVEFEEMIKKVEAWDTGSVKKKNNGSTVLN